MVVETMAKNEDYNETTLIRITMHNWKRLSALKEPGDSFNTVIGRKLDELEAFKEKEKVSLAEYLEARK